MYRITCYCGKTDFYRTETTKSWVNRKCKKCKSNLIIYQNDILVINYNNKKDRDLNRVKRIKKSKVPSVFNQVPFYQHSFQPVFFQMPYVPILPKPLNPIKSDVFMGYQGKLFVMTPVETYPKDMDIDVEVKQEKHEFEFNL